MKVNARAGWLLVGGAWLWATTVAIAIALPPSAGPSLPNLLAFENESGHHQTYNLNGPIDLTNPFFQSLGSNGRACSSCHQPSDGWSITPKHLRERFAATGGLDAVFRPNDGANSPAADVASVAARRTAYSLLLSKGLIRIGLAIPADAEFELVAVDDPYGHASAADLSVYRRPLPTTNLRFLSAVMWDGRETFAGQSFHFNLSDQANTATLVHAAAASPLTDRQRQEIVGFELGLFTAQSDDRDAGDLQTLGAAGGPRAIANLPFSIGMNDVLGPDFDPRAFTLFDAWKSLVTGTPPHAAPRPRVPFVSVRDPRPDPATAAAARSADARRAIARGQEIFNTRPIPIAGVNGLNDVLRVPVLQGTCTTCHDTPNAGNHSTSLPLDLGLTTEARRTPDLPLYTFRNRTTAEIVRTTDPGRALVTGKWKDMSLFKGPILRALAARPPYFHNGSAATLEDVIDFYNLRFGLMLTTQDRSDLAAFLRAL